MTTRLAQSPPAGSHTGGVDASRPGVAHGVAVGSLVLWGLIHLAGGAVMVVASTTTPMDALATFATVPTVPFTGALASAITHLVGFHGFNIAAAGIATMVLAWRTRRGAAPGLLAPLVIASIADLGLVVFFLAPGVMPWVDGAPGLVLLAIAAGAARADARRQR